MTTLPEWLGNAAAQGLEKQALPRSVIFWLGRRIADAARLGRRGLGEAGTFAGKELRGIPGALNEGATGLGHALNWISKSPVRRGLVLPATAYYGTEAATAPWAGDKTMKKMRENYWGSVAGAAGDSGAQGGHNRWMDWLTRPTRAFMAGGEESSVPNTLTGKKVFTPESPIPGGFDAEGGATNMGSYGTMKHELSQYQRAQQALARQAAKEQEQAVQAATNQASNGKSWFGFGPSRHETNERMRQRYQEAFPGVSLPEAGQPQLTPDPLLHKPASTPGIIPTSPLSSPTSVASVLRRY